MRDEPSSRRLVGGRYVLEREIGRGGMSAVWLGTDQVLERPVALKRIGMLPGADTTDLARAEREAHLAARLSHPHVVAVLNLVLDRDTDSTWLVMEHVEGTTLGRLVREHGPLSPDEAAPLLRQTADALVAAHAAGIVHRDVKPSNILVDQAGRAKLTDFGIARVTTDASLTQTGLVTGSPAYLAPEVASGQRGDESVDVWSLGAMAFYVLSGRTPYEIGDNVLGGLFRIVNDDPPRLSDKQAGWLAPMLEGTMVKDPAARWSMKEVRDFLAHRRLPRSRREDTPLLASPPQGGPRMRRGWLVALAAATAVVLVGVLGFALLPRGDSGDQATVSAPPTSSPPTSTSTPSARPVKAGPTARGMRRFVRGYVAAVGSDPARAWTMLTPKFQRESGGVEKYRAFWDGVGQGTTWSIKADPRSLVVSYHVRFDHFGTGERPTVLQLRYDDGRYRIDGEFS